jgi:hypothetical protein
VGHDAVRFTYGALFYDDVCIWTIRFRSAVLEMNYGLEERIAKESVLWSNLGIIPVFACSD